MKLINSRFIFYLISLTWGLPLTLIGAVISFILIITGHIPEKFGPCLCFYIGKSWGGLEGGIFFFRDHDSDISVSYHELGHGYQNCYLGFLEPFLVTIPSAIRYWYRRISVKLNPDMIISDYDDIWFERQATRLGDLYLENHARPNSK